MPKPSARLPVKQGLKSPSRQTVPKPNILADAIDSQIAITDLRYVGSYSLIINHNHNPASLVIIVPGDHAAPSSTFAAADQLLT